MIQTKTPPAANAAADRREGPVAAMRYRGNENYDALPEALLDSPALLALDGHDAAGTVAAGARGDLATFSGAGAIAIVTRGEAIVGDGLRYP